MPALLLLLSSLLALLAPLAAQDTFNGRTGREWLQLLREADDQGQRDSAFWALSVMGERALAPVLGALDDADPRIRLAAVQLTERLGPAAAQAEARLGTLGKDADATLAVWARAAQLAVTARRQDVAAIAARLQAKEAPLCIAAARALARLGADASPAVPALVELLGRRGAFYEDVQVTRIEHGPTQSEGVHLEAVRTLGSMQDAAAPAVPALGKLLREHPSPWVRSAAIAALRAIGTAAAPAIPDLVAQLDSDDWGDRRDAAHAISTIAAAAGGPQDEVVKALLRCLHDEVVWVRGAALASLQRLGPAAAPAVPDLIACLRSDDARDRRNRDHAIDALGAIGPAAEAAVAELEQIAAAGDTPTRGAARALASIAPETGERLPQVAEVVRDREEARLPWAVRRDRRIQRCLAELGGGNEAERLSAVLDLGAQFAREAAGPLARMLDEKLGRDLEVAVVGVLGDLGARAAAAKIRPRLDDPRLRDVAAFTLARFGDEASMPRLLEQFAAGEQPFLALAFAANGVAAAAPVLAGLLEQREAAQDPMLRLACRWLRDPSFVAPLRRQLEAVEQDEALSVDARLAQRSALLADLVDLDPAAHCDLVLAHLRDQEPKELPAQLAAGLARVQAPEALPVLLAAGSFHELNWYLDGRLLQRLDGLRLLPAEWEHVPLRQVAKAIASRLSIEVGFSPAVTPAHLRECFDHGEAYEFVPRGLPLRALDWLGGLPVFRCREADGRLGWLPERGGVRIVLATEAASFWRAEAARRLGERNRGK